MTSQNLPTGIQSFVDLRQTDCYYVDKTSHIQQLVSRGRHYFLSRPRRFGKSLLVDTLKELFEGNESLFQGLHIHDYWDWSVRHPIVRLSFDGKYGSPKDIERSALKQLKIIGESADLAVTPGDTAQDYLLELLIHLHHTTGQQVVVLVDEYDKPILDVIDNEAMAIANRDHLGGIYGIIKGSAEHVRFVFVTGVSMLSKVSLFSYLNNLTDISLRARYATICGYTNQDLESVFAPELEGLDRNEIRHWYNGYNWLGEEKVYNPWDILNLFDNRKFEAYWFESGVPSFLYKVMMQRRFSPVQLTNLVVDKEFITAFDVKHIGFESLMFQTGYLTIIKEEATADGTEYTLDFPNHEVQKNFRKGLLGHLTKGDNKIRRFGDNLIGLLLANDFEGFTANLRSFLAGLPYQWQGEHSPARYEAWYAAMLYVALDAPDVDIRLEESTSQGRSDMVLLHDGQVFVFEFKMVEIPAGTQPEAMENIGKTAAVTAIKQIQDRGYVDKYRQLQEPMTLIGLVFERSGQGDKPLALKAVPA
ncbi:MAG: AAA family ATPase [Gammaproteobacteria bacterium]|nr:AAA family ATPase [Gammaproteobacteria bacterium]